LSSVAMKKKNGEKKKVTSRAEEAALQRRWKQMLSSDLNPRLASTKKEDSAGTKRTKPVILQEHMQKVLSTMRPSVSPQEIRRLRRIYQEFDLDRGGGMPVPPDPGGVGNRASLM